MEIEIFPTSSDVQNTQGLCNKIGSKIGSNDFYARNGKNSTIADFAKSWMYVYNYNFTALKKFTSLLQTMIYHYLVAFCNKRF